MHESFVVSLNLEGLGGSGFVFGRRFSSYLFLDDFESLRLEVLSDARSVGVLMWIRTTSAWDALREATYLVSLTVERAELRPPGSLRATVVQAGWPAESVQPRRGGTLS